MQELPLQSVIYAVLRDLSNQAHFQDLFHPRHIQNEVLLPCHIF